MVLQSLDICLVWHTVSVTAIFTSMRGKLIHTQPHDRYMCFVAYPIVFSQHRGWGPGVSGLAFIGMAVGTMLAIASEPLCRRLINSFPKDPETGRPKPEASASIMLIGAILTAVGQLVFSWTCLPVTIHWAIPIAFGIPFGAGNTLSFIYGAGVSIMLPQVDRRSLVFLL
jgi:hypothetical protein